MTEVTLASLAMDFDVAKAEPAKKQTDDLRASARALEDQVKSTSQAVRDHAVSLGLSGTAAGRVEQSLRPVIAAYGQARDALGRFAQEDGNYRLSQDATAKMLLQNARTVEAYARQQEQAAKIAAKASADTLRAREAEMDATAKMLIRNAQLQDDLRAKEEQAAAVTASYAAKVANLKAQFDPFAAVQLKLSQNTKLLDDALAHGAITAEEHASALSQVTRAALNDVQALDRLQKAHGGAGEAAKLQTYQLLNLGRQGADVFVSLASGQALWMVAVQQGAQIGEIFAEAKTQGVGLKAALGGIAESLAPFAGLAAGLLALGAGLAVVAVGVKRNLDNDAAVRAFTGQLALNADGLNYNAQALASASKELSRYGLSAKDASDGLSTFVSAGIEAGKLKDYSIAAKSLSEVSVAFKDVKSAQEAVSQAFTGGFDAVQKLDEKLNFLTVAQYSHIKAMFEAGDASGAQAEAFQAFADKVDAAAEKARGPWEQSTRDLSNAWSSFLDNLADTSAIQGATSALEQLMGLATNAMQLGRGGEQGQPDRVPNLLSNDVQRQRARNLLNPITMGPTILSMMGDVRQYRAYQQGQATGLAALAAGGPQDSAAEKAYLGVVDALNLQLDQTKKINDAERVRLAAEKEVTAAISKGVTGEARLAEIRAKAGQVEQAKIDKERQAQARTADAAGLRAARVEGRGDNAIEQARAAELAAQLATTRNVEAISVIKAAQIAQELKAQEVRLQGQVKAKEISQADADAALSHYRSATAAKEQARALDAANQIAQRDLQQRQEALSFAQRTASIQAAAAKSVEEANAIETRALAERQAYDRDALEDSVAQRVVSGEITLTKGKLLLTEQRIAQAAEADAAAREQARRIVERDLALRQAALRNIADVAESEKGLAVSAGARREIEERILAARYKYETASIKAALQTETDTAKRAMLLGDLDALGVVYRNNIKALQRVDVAYSDVEDALTSAARAIDQQDWAGAARSLIDAFDTLKKALESSSLNLKIGAVAGVASAAGSVVGGTGGSVLGGIGAGAAAGAKLGSIVPGIGTAIGAGVGAIIGGLGGLFGGSSAKKKARQQAAAEAAAAEAQRVANVAAEADNLRLALLEAEGKTVELTEAKHQAYIASLAAENKALGEQVWAAQQKAEADAKAAEALKAATAAQEEVQSKIDALTLSSSELELQRREKERAAWLAANPALGDLIDKLYGLQDSAAASEKATAAMQAAQEAATSAMERQAEAMKTLGDSFQNALKNAEELSKSLQSFADSLLNELGLKGQQQNYAATRATFLAGAQSGNFDQAQAQAFLDASKANSTSTAAYQADVALVRALALGKVSELNAYPENLARLLRAIQADAQSKANGTPGYATGGAMQINGIPGIDQNVLSLNGNPIARVSDGEHLYFNPPGRGASNDNSSAALRAEVASLKQELGQALRQIAASNDKIESYLRNPTEAGRDAINVRIVS